MNKFYKENKHFLGVDSIRVWKDEETSKHGFAGYIDAYPATKEISINMALGGRMSPEESKRLSAMIQYSVDLLDSEKQ